MINRSNSLSKSDFSQKYIREADIASDNILEILKNNVVSGKKRLKNKRVKTSLFTTLTSFNTDDLVLFIPLFILTTLFVFFTCLWLSLGKSEIIANLLLASIIGYVIYIIGSTIYLFLILFEVIRKTRKQAITIINSYTIEPYYQIIEQLGTAFYKEHLHRVELKFKVFMGEENKIYNKRKQYLQSCSIFLAAAAIWMFEIPIEDFPGFLGIIIGISAIITFAQNPLYEYNFLASVPTLNEVG